MDKKVEEFLNLLESEDKDLISAIKAGYSVIVEGYADVVPDRVEQTTLERFNGKAANLAASMGNNLLHFLQNSSNILKSRFNFDDESHLDNNPTSPFNQHIEPNRKTTKSAYSHNYDEISDSLGLTINEVNPPKN